MGSHMVNVFAKETRNDQYNKPFDHTWIFGKQSCNISFWEPMITLKYFETLYNNNGIPDDGTTPSGPFPIHPPTHVPNANYMYPSQYDITYEGQNTFQIKLVNFVELQQSTNECAPPPQPPTSC